MARTENPLIKRVARLEEKFDFDLKRPLLSKWLSAFENFPTARTGYKGSMPEIIDIWRNNPLLDDFGGLGNGGSIKYLNISPLSQYKKGNIWNCSYYRLEELNSMVDGYNPTELLIEYFGKKGNIKTVTNLLYVFDKKGVYIPPHIIIETLYWAEFTQAKKLLERETSEKQVRLKNLGKNKREETYDKDPYFHLYSAYLLLGEFEKLSAGDTS